MWYVLIFLGLLFTAGIALVLGTVPTIPSWVGWLVIVSVTLSFVGLSILAVRLIAPRARD